MTEADALWEQTQRIFAQWGLAEIPFTETATNLDARQLRQVFTGRTSELRQVFQLVHGRERKRILFHGWMGIGKSALIREVLGVIQRKTRKSLAAYITLPPQMDLATAALVALAREMKDDEWAQHQLNQMGLLPRTRAVTKRATAKAGIAGSGVETEEVTVPVNAPRYPALSFEDLLERACARFDRVIIAIDDLDKLDPANVRRLLRDAQGMLKGRAWFMLTGHPAGLTRHVVTSELGLFDLAMELKPLDQETMYRMFVNYLNSARPKETQRDVQDPRAVWPYQPETARAICQRSDGIPRYLNRLGTYTLLKAAELGAAMITADVLDAGLAYANEQLRGQPGLSPEDYLILDLVLEKGILSDATVTLADLERVRALEFSEVMPALDRLVQLDLLQRLPSDRAVAYSTTPMIAAGGARRSDPA